MQPRSSPSTPLTHLSLFLNVVAVSLLLTLPSLSQGASTLCLQPADAAQVATNFQTLQSNYTDTLALSAVSPDYVEWSSSTNFLIDNCASSGGPQPLNQPTFTSRAAFMAGQGAQPPIPYQQLDMWFSCQTVIIRWQTSLSLGANVTATGNPVVGMLVIQTELAPEGNNFTYWMKTVYSEFDSVTWCKALGIDPTNSSMTPATPADAGSARMR